MVTRTRLTAVALGLFLGLLAPLAAGAEALPVRQTPVATRLVVDTQIFRREIDGYVRELNRQLRTTLDEDLRREPAPKIVQAADSPLTRS
jgi:hypothetical protein